LTTEPQTGSEIEKAYREASPHNFMLFARCLTIPSATGPQLFDTCMSVYQRETFSVLSSSLHAVREGRMPPTRRFWIERTKGAAKDSDLAVCLLWLIAFPRRPFEAQVGAVDREQAGIIKKRMVDLLYYNPWLKKFVAIQNWKVLNQNDPTTALDIMASDIKGSHGATPDFLVINELSHVGKDEFVLNLLSNAAKVPQGVVVVATNAGFKGTKAEVLRKNAIESDEWKVFIWDKPAPWTSKELLKEEKEINPTSRYNRLWWGKWSSGKGDALDEEDIDRCFCLPGPILKPEKDWYYIAGLDLGITHDHSGLVALGVNPTEQKIRVVNLKGWNPKDTNGKVDLIHVENTCRAWHKMYDFVWFGCDPTEAQLSMQQLTRDGIPMQEMTFSSGKNLTLMAESLIQVVEGGILECYEDEEGRLRRDFGKFNIVEKQYGYKLEAVSDEYGHADVGTALVICLPQAIDMLKGRVSMWADFEYDDNQEELTPEEVEDMPDDMRAVYDFLGEDHEEQKQIRLDEEY